MDSLQSSSNIIATNPITFQNQKIYFSYSKSQHLHSSKKGSGAQTPTSPSNILLCSILTPIFPISTSTLYTIMSPYGRVLRIVIFQKKGLQAFVEFESPYSAWVAKEALNGQDIYTGSCTLQIDYARVATLNVKQNDDKTYDYTSEHPGFSLPSYSPFPQPGAPGVHPAQLDPTYAKPAGPYMMMGQQAATTMGIPPYGMYSAAPGAMGIEPPSQTVIMVHRLADSVTSDQLFNLFCLYGNVIKIKMLQGAKSGAMVQMGDGIQADTAIHCLNGASIFGQRLSVFHSKHPAISESDKTKDFTDSPLNRFTKGGLGSYKNIYKPSATLYFINVPTSFTEKDLTHLFINTGTHAPNTIKFFPPSGPKLMGLIEFSDVKWATEALMILYHITKQQQQQQQQQQQSPGV
ncbi:RNA-binding region RNP-1 domain-containing protein [Cavenderia fasciculata]|uniref:RNA-binding region RNP-1 domain-containing protein n=1 Tax=Cavenderia fasciculata TaxID=261658 RepID=F4PMW4_CACFS|nr:RNA-binding region RNP-1 domain-containing protein [Cavenderia fasciculata]EGG23708.1 RNA-binding region RNP-1 domain-containing protein [Cavenderia fasciculata]|eukprot:XP_004361559.1 RNA-binding region RNP-1 domain-containing protein [Cavenderia fasciculata]